MKPVLVLEAKSPAGENYETVTFYRLCSAIVRTNFSKERKKEQILKIVPEVDRDWFEVIDMFPQPLPKDDAHVDWRKEEHKRKALEIASACNGRTVVWANRPWQAIKAAAGKTFDEIKFCETQELVVGSSKMMSAWIWHPADSIRELFDPDEKRIGKFMWDLVQASRDVVDSQGSEVK